MRASATRVNLAERLHLQANRNILSVGPLSEQLLPTFMGDARELAPENGVHSLARCE